MKIGDKIKDKKLQHDIDREAAKISALSQVKLIYTNILQEKKYYHLIKVE